MPPLSRAAIVIPPIRDFYFTPHRFSSLGARIVERLVERHGIETTFFDFPLLKNHGTPLPLPQELAYLQPFMIEHETGGTSFFTKFRRFGPDTATCAKIIADARPELCLFSVFAFAYADDALALASAVKQRLPQVPILVGGGGPSVFPEYFLAPAVDYVLTGEAEAALGAFLVALGCDNADFSQIPNLWFWQNGSIRKPSRVVTAEADRIETPLVKTAETGRIATWTTALSRGCPMNCTFCSSHLTLGKLFRTPLPERLTDALSSIDIGVQSSKKQLVINIEDDNMLADDRFMRQTVTAIRTRFPAAEIVMENGIDYRFLTPEKTIWLIDNGMRKFNISLGSLDPDTLRSKQRACSFEQYEATLAQLDQSRIPSVTYFICGFAEDTVETVARSLRYLASKNTTIGISPFYAVPGIADFCDVSRFDGKPSPLCLGAACYPWNRSLSTETLITAFRMARYVNLTKTFHRSEIERQLVDKIRDTQLLYTIIREPGTKLLRIVEVGRQDTELVRMFFRG